MHAPCAPNAAATSQARTRRIGASGAPSTTSPPTGTAYLWPGFCQHSRQQVSPVLSEAGGRSSGSQDTQHGHGPPEEEQPTAIGGNMSVMAGAEAEKVAELIV